MKKLLWASVGLLAIYLASNFFGKKRMSLARGHEGGNGGDGNVVGNGLLSTGGAGNGFMADENGGIAEGGFADERPTDIELMEEGVGEGLISGGAGNEYLVSNEGDPVADFTNTGGAVNNLMDGDRGGNGFIQDDTKVEDVITADHVVGNGFTDAGVQGGGFAEEQPVESKEVESGPVTDGHGRDGFIQAGDATNTSIQDDTKAGDVITADQEVGSDFTDSGVQDGGFAEEEPAGGKEVGNDFITDEPGKEGVVPSGDASNSFKKGNTGGKKGGGRKK